jgi:hypothetical protein
MYKVNVIKYILKYIQYGRNFMLSHTWFRCECQWRYNDRRGVKTPAGWDYQRIRGLFIEVCDVSTVTPILGHVHTSVPVGIPWTAFTHLYQAPPSWTDLLTVHTGVSYSDYEPDSTWPIYFSHIQIRVKHVGMIQSSVICTSNFECSTMMYLDICGYILDNDFTWKLWIYCLKIMDLLSEIMDLICECPGFNIWKGFRLKLCT